MISITQKTVFNRLKRSEKHLYEHSRISLHEMLVKSCLRCNKKLTYKLDDKTESGQDGMESFLKLWDKLKMEQKF